MKNPDENQTKAQGAHEKPWGRGLLYAWAATTYASIALVGGLLLYFFYVLFFG